MSSRFLLAFFIAAAALAEATFAQNGSEDFVAAHDATRAAVVGVTLDPVRWDETVAAFAANYASQLAVDCQLQHSTGSGYGENLFWGYGTSYTAAEAVSSWASEKDYYDYDSNSCDGGYVCGHYTQVVWSSSTAIGCARVQCESGDAVIISCNYYPPGNIVGERPY